jgi:hypothetical protein
VAGVASLGENLGRAFAGLEVRRLREGTVLGGKGDQKQNRRQAERSARHPVISN